MGPWGGWADPGSFGAALGQLWGCCGDAVGTGWVWGLRCQYPAGSGELEKFKHVLGGSKLVYSVRPSRHCHESVFYVEGLAFPDVAFSGLVSLHVTLLESPEKVQLGGTGGWDSGD